MPNSENIGILDPDGINLNPLNGEQYSDKYKELAKVWSKFPAYKKAREIIDEIKSNQVILITSGTGSGKTVLLPKFMLHVFNYEKKIAVTLPKQMIAQSAAEYASICLDVKLGDDVGYKFKGAPKRSMKESTRLLFATDGTIVAKLLNDPKLEEYSAVLVDEAHERKVQIDFLLYLLKNTCKLRPDFKIVIMSATVNENVFTNYFNEFRYVHFDVGGETNYPINSIFLDKSINSKSYIEKGIETIKTILNETTDGDILFFVTSVQETIDSCKTVINNDKNNESFCVEVFAGINQSQQELAQQENKSGKRKILVGTNVAESSLTISNIKYVIDSGYELFNYYDPKIGAKVLVKQFITQAQAKQRMGRAGRTGPGTCYHLYTKDEFENQMMQYPLPGIKVSNITSECLKLLSLKSINDIEKLKEVLNNFIEPPEKLYVASAIDKLTKQGLLTNNSINDLGSLVADLQLEPEQGLSIYYAYRLGCVKEVIAIIAMIESSKGNINELFKIPKTLVGENDGMAEETGMTKKYMRAKKSLTDKNNGDHITLLKIFNKYKIIKNKKNEKKLNDWLYENFLKESVLVKANKYYQRIKQIAITKLKNQTNSQMFTLSNEYKLSTKIMASLMSGYFLNIIILKKYNTINKNNYTKVSKDSFLNFYNDFSTLETKDLMYNEMVIVDQNTNISIVSRILKSHKDLYKTITAEVTQ